MPADNERLLRYSVRDLLERATALILRESEHFPRLDKRLDLQFDLQVYDPKIGRKHPVRTKVRITAVSELFGTKEQ